MINYSVIVPCFNAEHDIESVLISVIEQVDAKSYHIELIVVDDKSSDSSLFVLDLLERAYKNTAGLSISILKNTVNMGVSYSRNRGISYSNGDYIVFLDSDDVFLKGKFRKIDKIISQNKVDFIFHSWNVEGQDYNGINHKKLTKVSRRFIYWNLIKNQICTPCTVIAKDKVQLFDESLHRMEDLENWTRIMLDCNNIYWLDEPLTCLGHELNEGAGLSSNNVAMRQSEYEMYRILARKNRMLALSLPIYLSVHFLKRLRDYFRK